MAAMSARRAGPDARCVSSVICAAPRTSGSEARQLRAALAAGNQQRGHTMTVSNGRRFLSIPGPTNVPDEVLAAMQRPAMDIYAGELVDLTDSCLKDLATVFRTEGRTYIYAANGHGGW